MNARTESTKPEPSDERVQKEVLTWQQKLEKGVPFNSFDETKADADFNYRQRLRDEEAKQAFEDRKEANRNRQQVLMEEKKGKE